MESLSDEAESVLRAIVEAPEAWCWESAVTGGAREEMEAWRRPWCSRADLTRWLDGLEALGHRPETLLALAESGWVEPWDRPGLPRAWTLTPIGAERLGVGVRDRWAHRRTQRQGQWIRDHHEEPCWGPLLPVEHDDRPSRQPRDGALGLGSLEIADDAPRPETAAMVAECGRLTAEFGRTGDVGLLHRAESIVAGVLAEARRAWLWDEVTDLPRLVMGRPVPRDPRLGARAG